MKEILLTRRSCASKVLAVVAFAAALCGGNYAYASEASGGDSMALVAPNQTVSGVVVDAKGQPVVGAAVIEKGVNNGTMTDVDGKFTLNVKSGAKLEISCLGYATQTVAAVNGVKIVLVEDALYLEDVVVVGFGTQKKENLTGAVTSVNVGKSIGSRPIADVGRGLQGAAAGLNVRIGSAEVGTEPILRIRGQFGSIKGSASPLILLDNVEIPSIQLVNPDDIESVSILKDAASASIYGAKAAFGVILINSKKGSKDAGKVKVSYSGNVAVQSLEKDIQIADVNGLHYTVQAFERALAAYAGYPWYVSRDSWKAACEWKKKYGSTIGPNDPMVYGRDYYYDGTRVFGVRTYDPKDYMIRKFAPSTAHNLSVAGNKGKTDYNISLGYLDQEGMMKPAKHDDYKRWNANVRINSRINDWLEIHAGTMFTKTQKRWAYNTSVGAADMWYYTYRWGSTIPLVPYDSNGISLRGPVQESSDANTAINTGNYVSVNAGTLITPIKNWNIRFDYTYSHSGSVSFRPGTRFIAGDTWSTPSLYYNEDGTNSMVENEWSKYNGLPATFENRAFSPIFITSKGDGIDHVYQSSGSYVRRTVSATTDYTLNIANEHNFKFMLGTQGASYDGISNWSKKTELMDYKNPQFDLATGTQTSGGDFSWSSTLGFFGRINYNYKEKYLLEANLRYDGSSKFPTHLKWMWFPSFSAGWRVTQEPWMESIKPYLSNFKIRVSWGAIGDQSVSGSMYLPTMNGDISTWLHNDAKDSFYKTPTPVAQDLTWQKIKTLDVGFDASFFNEFEITFDWYRRATTGMIVPGPGVSYTYGATAPQGNFGSLRTDGWDLALNWGHLFENGLSLSLNATISDALTTITEYSGTKSISSWYVGKHYGEIWGFRVDRLYQNSDFERDASGKLIVVKAEDPSNPEGYKYRHYKPSDPSMPLQGKYNASSTIMFGPGDVKYKDLNGDGVIDKGDETTENPGDLSVIGNTTPRYEYSFRIDAAWKGFDLSMFFQGIGKRDMWGSSSLTLPGYNSSDGSMAATFANDFWYEEFDDSGNLIDSNYNAFYPRAYNLGGGTNNFNMMHSDKYLLNMAYFRFKNLTLGYTLSKNIMKKVSASSLRFYLSMENVFTFDHLRGLPIDPEEIPGRSSLLGSNYNASRAGVGAPAFRTTSLGVQLTF